MLGFWSTLSIVISSMLGTSMFVLPGVLAKFGYLSVFGWIASAIFAILLSFIFSKLSFWLTKTGGPHVFIKESFGNNIGFFAGWIYWMISWMSTTVVVFSAAKYLLFFFNYEQKLLALFVQLLIIFLVRFLNLKGLNFSGKLEIFLTIIKIIPFLIVPLIAIFKFKFENILIPDDLYFDKISFLNIFGKIIVLTFWGFVGIETATVPAEQIDNPKKNLPKALLIGSIIVSIIYIFNTISILGFFSKYEINNSSAVYADVIKVFFGSGILEKIVSILSFLICFTTINTWTLVSAQVAFGLSKDRYLPKFFSKLNENGVPKYGILISSLGMIPILMFMLNEKFCNQISELIDLSVIIFVFIYALCCLSFMKICLKHKNKFSNFILGLITLIFCLFLLIEANISSFMFLFFIIFLSFPFYFLYKKNK